MKSRETPISDDGEKSTPPNFNPYYITRMLPTLYGTVFFLLLSSTLAKFGLHIQVSSRFQIISGIVGILLLIITIILLRKKKNFFALMGILSNMFMIGANISTDLDAFMVPLSFILMHTFILLSFFLFILEKRENISLRIYLLPIIPIVVSVLLIILFEIPPSGLKTIILLPLLISVVFIPFSISEKERFSKDNWVLAGFILFTLPAIFLFYEWRRSALRQERASQQYVGVKHERQ
jgi:hypothetical protein